MRLADAVEFCFQHRDAWISGSGAKTARINSNHVVRILGPDLDVNDIKTEHFATLTSVLLSEGKSGSTVNRVTCALSTVLSELRQNGIPAAKVEFKRQKESKPRPSYFKEEEVDMMLLQSSQLDDYMLLHDSIMFSIKTGCRQGELLSLTVDDIDIEKREIVFRDTKNGSDHWLKMHEELVPILERRLQYRINQELFPWRDKYQLLRDFKLLAEEAQVPLQGRVWHTLRHSVATWLCERQVPLRTVMGVLNHRNVATTLRYAKASDRAVAAAIDVL
jgi:integrase